MSQRPIRIAISGRGLAGATLAHALLKHAHLDVHIFESAEAFKEAGAAVGIARNALSALDLIGPPATTALRRAGAAPQKGVRFMLAQGPGAGDDGVMIDEIDAGVHGKQVVSIVHRAAFVRELLADVPAGPDARVQEAREGRPRRGRRHRDSARDAAFRRWVHARL